MADCPEAFDRVVVPFLEAPWSSTELLLGRAPAEYARWARRRTA